jgi:hypothetical protein
MEYRVTQSFPIAGDVSSEAGMDHLLDRLLSVAPDAGPVVTLGLERRELDVTLAFDAGSKEDAVRLAKLATGVVLGGGANRVDVECADGHQSM